MKKAQDTHKNDQEVDDRHRAALAEIELDQGLENQFVRQECRRNARAAVCDDIGLGVNDEAVHEPQ